VPDELVLAFPGQGSLTPGVGVPWREHPAYAAVGAVSAETGTDVAALLETAPEDELVSTENAQLATFALSLCVLAATGLDDRATLALGHSLGEYTALVAAGVVAPGDGARLVAARGAAMRAAAEAAPGGLVALLGGTEALAVAACEAVPGLAVANLNGPAQVVVGGSTEVLEEVSSRAKELGFRRAIALRVGGAFHTPLMAPAATALAPALEQTSFAKGSMAVVANVDGAVHDDPAEWPALLLRQLTSAVRFEDAIRVLPAGATLVECGPGRVLQGLIARIRDDLQVVSVGVPDDLSALDGR
jgi:[acyl-carrier-protein] S-malonyltransferase